MKKSIDDWYNDHDRIINRTIRPGLMGTIDQVDLAWANSEIACRVRGWDSQAAHEAYARACAGNNN